jgi:hypothetical protein
MRILHDAHDADVIDLRRRGGDYEVSPAAAAPPVDRQLEVAAKANAPEPKPQPPVVRGMAARGIGRGPMGAKAAPPANLLVGVVASAKAATPAAAPTNTAKAPDDQEAVAIVETQELTEKPSRGRKKTAAKKAPKPAAKSPRGRKKAAAKTPASAGNE